MDINYHDDGDYQIPDLIMDEQPEGQLGKYSRMRKQYLIDNKSTQYQNLLISNDLTKHLIETENAVQERLELIIKQMAHSQGVDEQMKEKDQLEWIKTMNNITASAEEIVLKEIVYN